MMLGHSKGQLPNLAGRRLLLSDVSPQPFPSHVISSVRSAVIHFAGHSGSFLHNSVHASHAIAALATIPGGVREAAVKATVATPAPLTTVFADWLAAEPAAPTPRPITSPSASFTARHPAKHAGFTDGDGGTSGIPAALFAILHITSPGAHKPSGSVYIVGALPT